MSSGHSCSCWGRIIIFLLGKETSSLEKKKNWPQAGNIWEKEESPLHLPLFNCLLQIDFSPYIPTFPFEDPSPWPLHSTLHLHPPHWHPLLLQCPPLYLPAAANALLSPVLPCPSLPLWLLPCSLVFIQSPACYCCNVCATSAWAAFPAALYYVRTALKQLWFSSALLLSLLGCLSTFQALLHSGLKALSIAQSFINYHQQLAKESSFETVP